MPSIPFLSVIIPVYNVAPYLDECLNSLVQQGASPSSYEIICVDDGSSDGSGEILDKFASQYSNIIVTHQKNGGVSNARNAGLDKASGEYVWFVDADDFIADRSLCPLMSMLKEKRPDLLFVLPIAFEDGTDVSRFHVPNPTPDESSGEYVKWLWTRLYRRQIIADNGIRFQPGMAYAEDNLFCAMLRPYVKDEIKTDRVAYFYRKREGSFSSKPTKKKLDSLIYACTVFKCSAEEGKISQEDAAFVICPTMITIMSAVASMRGKEAQECVKNIHGQGLFPLNKRYRNRQEYNPKGLNTENRLLQKMKLSSYTLLGYYRLRGFRLLLRIKRRIL